MKHGAAAIFVKTPGISPIKTRLAVGIGQINAESFYKMSCQATGEVLDGFCLMSHVQIQPYWAVAEPQGLNSQYWQKFPNIQQGEGSLGAKLHHVYSQLLAQHDYVIILGGDCPQINREPLLRAVDVLTDRKAFTLGKSYDGGFWLFGGNTPVPKEIWTSIAYSQDNTAAELEASLAQIAPVTSVQKLQDVDIVDDLTRLKQELINQQVLSQGQSAIVSWLSSRGLAA